MTQQAGWNGESCTVMIMGRLFRCVMIQCEMGEHMSDGMGLVHRSMRCEYRVLEELALDAAATATVQAAVNTAAQAARDRDEREITL